MQTKLITCLALFYLVAATTVAPAAERSPFEEPAAPPQALFNYKAAKNQIRITGLITTDTNGKVIVQTDPERPAAVYSAGSRLTVFHHGVAHVYKIIRINRRSILIKAANDKTYEVEVD